MESSLNPGELINVPSGTITTVPVSSRLGTTHIANSSVTLTSTGKKKRKSGRKLPFEPTKRITGYGLFFREHNAQIRESNPHATFGDVSKAVAKKWGSTTEAVKDHYRNLPIWTKENYIKSLAIHMPDALYAFKMGNESNHNIPCKMKQNDVPFYPQIYGAKAEEAKTPRHKDAFGITRDENAFKGNAFHNAHSSKSTTTSNKIQDVPEGAASRW